MIKTVSYLVVGALAASAWVVNAEAQGTGNPTGGKFAKEHPRRNEVNTRVENQRERINQGLKSQGRKRSSFAPTIVPLSSRSMPTSKATADI
jgi:hypothetical protein